MVAGALLPKTYLRMMMSLAAWRGCSAGKFDELFQTLEKLVGGFSKAGKD